MPAPVLPHQYVERPTGAVRTERLTADAWIRWLYGPGREHLPSMFRAVVSPRMSRRLGEWRFDRPLSTHPARRRAELDACGVVDDECLEPVSSFRTLREVFERRITYWTHRPLPPGEDGVVSPADARALVGSFLSCDGVLVKEKFFDAAGLVGADREPWRDRFHHGDFAVFRLTPDKYHYTHTPVAGLVVDTYEVQGLCHSCNPGALVVEVGAYALNRRSVTVFQTDVPGGSQVGLVAMVEVVALMIGRIEQGYCDERYDHPEPLAAGHWARRGQPKAVFRPGSSTVVLLFEPGRVRFSDDLASNATRRDVTSRFSAGLGRPLVETELRVRERVALPLERA